MFRTDLSEVKAIDGIYLPSEAGLEEPGSLFVTNQELSPWIQIDLAISHFVEGVKIWDRSESVSQGELVYILGSCCVTAFYIKNLHSL